MAGPTQLSLKRIHDKSAVLGVIGLGYVGLPLAAAAAEANFITLGFDVDESKLPKLNAGISYIDAVPSADLKRHVEADRLSATSDLSRLRECDLIVICVPTPLTARREPDMTYVVNTTHDIAKTLRRGQTIILESTTYPGTTTQVVRPILEGTGLKSGSDFFLGFSPEREDPGNQQFGTRNIPKVVSGDGLDAGTIVRDFYSSIVSNVVPVSTPDTAEAVKITENVFRAVNIALVNELKVIYEAMGINIWEVIDAAKTKPFGFMPFYPGPGLGGHCIPIDPFYLTSRAREFDVATRFIELAGEINTAMPRLVVNRLAEALDRHAGMGLTRSRILLLGLAYKKNMSDTRESPALRIMRLLEDRGATCDFHDPHVDVIPRTRDYPDLAGKQCRALTADAVAAYDAVLVITDHDHTDYQIVASHADLVVDTRNVFRRRGLEPRKLVLS